MDFHTTSAPCTSSSIYTRKRKAELSVFGTNFESMSVDPLVPASYQESSSCSSYEAATAYIADVAKKYRAKMRRKKKQTEELDVEIASEMTSHMSMEQRLKILVGECDIRRKTCYVPMCGRIFDSVPVLAFHMSYSHHDLAIKSAYDTLCFVCGLQMDNVKGKVIHLVSKHKDLCAAHNEQCISQRNSVISPLAPAALRIAQYTEEEEEEYVPYEGVAFENFSGNLYNKFDFACDDIHYE